MRMVEYTSEDLRGSRFRDVYLNDARFEDVVLTGARFRLVDLSKVQIRGALLADVEISGDIENVTINGVDIGPLIEAELNRRHPERAKLNPTDVEGFREAWEIVEQAWGLTVERARKLPPELLHERVDDEWSFIETQRHLIFVIDAWVKRAILGDPSPYDPLDLHHDDMAPDPTVPGDPDARPSLDEVRALVDDRAAVVREFLSGLTEEVLAGETNPIPAPGYPAAGTYAVRRCLDAVVNEYWQHRLIAERDLAVLESRA
jgi:hypothetical protein